MLVVTEHLSHLDAKRARHYEEIRAVPEDVANRPASSIHYRDVERLAPALSS